MGEEFIIVESSRLNKDLPQKFKSALKDLDEEATRVARKQLGLAPGGMAP